MLAATHALVLSQYHCPPSCHNNELGELLDRFCSDKGTFWQSKHHYHTAYHSVFGSIRKGVRSILEVGIGEDTAPSVAAWTEYFPNAQIFPVDIKSRQGFDDRAKPGGATAGVAKHQAKFGCVYNASMWKHPRVHLTLDTDASEPAQLQRIPNLPELLDIIIDDGSHRFHDQETMLLTLWPRLRPGGFYVVEDVLVGALPWDENHAKQVPRAILAQFSAQFSRPGAAASSSLQVPTANSGCSNECFFPQRPAEHPFIVDRFGHLKKHPLPGAAAARPKLRPEVEQLLMNHDWFWAITGVHQGGGMDTTMIIRKKGPAIDAAPPGVALAPAASVEAGGGGGGGGGDGVALKRAQDALREAQRQQQLLHAQFSQLEEQVRPATAGGRPALCDGDGDGGDGDGPRPRKALRGPWWLWALLLGSAVFNYVQARQVDALRTKGAASSR